MKTINPIWIRVNTNPYSLWSNLDHIISQQTKVSFFKKHILVNLKFYMSLCNCLFPITIWFMHNFIHFSGQLAHNLSMHPPLPFIPLSLHRSTPPAIYHVGWSSPTWHVSHTRYASDTWRAMRTAAFKCMTCPQGMVLRISLTSLQITGNIDYKLYRSASFSRKGFKVLLVTTAKTSNTPSKDLFCTIFNSFKAI